MLELSGAPPAGTMLPFDAEGEKSSNPIFMRMMPPTIRTMLKGTPNKRKTRLPRNKKKKHSNIA